MIRIAICDDDLNFLDSFERLLTRSFADVGQRPMISKFSEGKSLIKKVEKENQIFDIIFLDVEMPGVHGFIVAQRLREVSPPFILVFTTYIENQSREGYLYGAFRYVFKNNLEDEISEAVASIISKLDNWTDNQEEITLKCRTSGVLENVTMKKTDIVFLQTEKTRRVTLKTTYSEYELLVKPLSEYAELLDPSVFVSIMRSYLLNFNHVEAIEAGSFILTGGLTVPLGIKREARNASMEKYLKFLEERI